MMMQQFNLAGGSWPHTMAWERSHLKKRRSSSLDQVYHESFFCVFFSPSFFVWPHFDLPLFSPGGLGRQRSDSSADCRGANCL